MNYNKAKEIGLRIMWSLLAIILVGLDWWIG